MPYALVINIIVAKEILVYTFWFNYQNMYTIGKWDTTITKNKNGIFNQ